MRYAGAPLLSGWRSLCLSTEAGRQSPLRTSSFCIMMAAVYGLRRHALRGAQLLLVPCAAGKMCGACEPTCYQRLLLRPRARPLHASTVLGPFVFGIDPSALCKPYLMWNVLSVPFFVQGAFFEDDSGPCPDSLLPVNLWISQVGIAAVFIILNILVVKDIKTKGSALF